MAVVAETAAGAEIVVGVETAAEAEIVAGVEDAALAQAIEADRLDREGSSRNLSPRNPGAFFLTAVSPPGSPNDCYG